MNWSSTNYNVRFQFNGNTAASNGWVVLDDFFPNLLTGFRVAKYNAYLQRFPRLTVLSTLPDFSAQARPYARVYPELADRVRRFSIASATGARFAYLNFLNNASAFLPFLERHAIPFVLTLYPGGGFGIDDPASDAKLRNVCASSCLKHVIVTQKRTDTYISALHPSVPRTLIYGCVINPMYFADDAAARSWYGTDKVTFDICFVAEKYMPQGRNKGYPAFVEAGKRILAAIPAARFHVCGGFAPDDWPLGELEGRTRFLGRLATRELRRFFADMDVIASPNVPFTIGPGNFDGFPTASCTEASLCGVAMVVSDVLGLNLHYDAGRELVIAPPEPEAIAEAVIALGRKPDCLRAVAIAGQKRSAELFAPQRQIDPRVAVLEREAGSVGVAL